MYDHYELFKDVTLGDLMLVYTHDAAAYKYNTKYPFYQMFCHKFTIESFMICRHYEFKGDDNFATLLTFAQEQELGQQLQWGARHLDIRVSYCKKTYHRNVYQRVRFDSS